MNTNPVKKCRTCLKNNTKMYPLTKHVIGFNPKATYSQLLQEYAKLKCPAEYEHLMPQNVCVLCCRELNNFYSFIRQAQYCNDKLINVIAKQLSNLQERATIKSNNDDKLNKFGGITLENDTTNDCSPQYDTHGTLPSNVHKNVVKEFNDNVQNESNDDNSESTISHHSNTIRSNATVEYSSDHYDITCPICVEKVNGHNNLLKHLRTHHDIEVPSAYLNNQKPQQIKPVRDKHSTVARKENQNPKDKIIKCCSCDYTARTYSALNFHTRSKHGNEENKFKCKFCSYMSLKKFSLFMHVKKSHKELIRTLKGNLDNKLDERQTFNDDVTTDNSAITKEKDNPLDENENSSSDWSTSLEQNVLKSFSKYNFNAEIDDDEEEISDEIFIRNILNIKKRQPNTISTKSLPRRCDECGNIYNNLRALKTHKNNVHISEEKYSLCQQCGKKFKRRSNLRIHIKNAHTSKTCTESVRKPANKTKEKRFMCAECSYVCGTITTLTIHINRNHTGEKPYKCDICYKSFIVPYNLKIHRYLHTGERPYKCSVCSKCFRSTSQLIKHKRIHSNERPYQCKDCDKSFTQSYNLSLHKRIHLKEKKLNCNICEKLFENQSVLNMHRFNENHHEEVV